MKRIAGLALLSFLGMVLIFLSGIFGSWADGVLFHPEMRLSKAQKYLEQGDLEAHERALTDFILADGGSDSLRAVALYNLGSCVLAKAAQGDPVAANDALYYFKEALRNDPLLFHAKFNLEILLRAEREAEEAQGEDASPSATDSAEVAAEEKTDEISFPPPFLGSAP